MIQKGDNMKEILNKLRWIRKSKGISIEELHNYLLKNDIQVAKKTVYGWDCGITTPNVKIFVLICQLYGIKNVYDLFNKDTPDMDILTITDKEKEVVKQFRKKKEYQSAVLKLLDLE